MYPVGDTRETAVIIHANRRRTIQYLGRVEDIVDLLVLHESVHVYARSRDVEIASDEGSARRDLIADLPLEVVRNLGDDREIHPVCRTLQGGVLDRHRLKGAVTRALTDTQ